VRRPARNFPVNSPIGKFGLVLRTLRRPLCHQPAHLRRGTGAWNTWAVRDELHGSYAVLFAGQVVAVVLSGLTAWLHARAMTPAVRGGFGAANAAFALLAVLLGVQLTL